MKPFKEYINEAFSLNKVKYGTNLEMDNGKIEREFGDSLYTFMEFKGVYYIILLTDGEVEFGSSKTASTNPEDYSLDRASTKNPLAVLGSIMYVVGKMVKRDNPDRITFSGADKGLEKLYNKIAKNPSFIKIMKDFGYEHYSSKNDGVIYVKPGVTGDIDAANRKAFKNAINPFS